MKVILNKCYGGFGFSHEAIMLFAKEKGITLFPYASNHPNKYSRLSDEEADNAFLIYYFTEDFGDCPKNSDIDWSKHFYFNDDYRADPVAVSIVERLGERANGRFAKLVVVDIPDGMKYTIDDYDGVETLHEAVPVW